MKPKVRRAIIPLHHEREREIVKIVADGAIASPNVGDGRLIPILILDTENRPDIAECIRIHEHLPPGDVTTQWGTFAAETVALILSFVRPMELVAIVQFDVAAQGVLVEKILSSRAVYLQAGKVGDRVKYTIDAPKIIAEIPDTGFRPAWDKIFLRGVVEKLRKRGLSRQHAKRTAKLMIEELRRLGEIRVPTASQIAHRQTRF